MPRVHNRTAFPTPKLSSGEEQRSCIPAEGRCVSVSSSLLILATTDPLRRARIIRTAESRGYSGKGRQVAAQKAAALLGAMRARVWVMAALGKEQQHATRLRCSEARLQVRAVAPGITM